MLLPPRLRSLETHRLLSRERRQRRRRLRPTLLTLEGRELLSMLTVSSTNDSGTGSLRAAVNQANSDGGGDTIVFSSLFNTPQTITLTSGQLELKGTTAPTTITGPAAGVTVSGNNASRVFQVDSGVTATISGLTITGGNAFISSTFDGGGLANLGTVTVSGCTFTSNSASNGGGLDNETGGTATVLGSTFTSNSASNNNGGGLDNSGTATVSDSTFTSNSAVFGGGIANESGGTATVSDSTFTGNFATPASTPSGSVFGGDGGGLYNGGTATVLGSTFTSNSASSDGGGIDNFGTATVLGSSFTSNSAVFGGGIANESSGTATVLGSSFTSNSANGNGGGLDNSGTATVSGSTFTSNSAVDGGGLANNSGTATVLGSTFTSNFASGTSTSGGLGGGIANFGTATVSGSTFTGNFATPASTSGSVFGGEGGGVLNSGTATVLGSTFTSNSATFGGGVFNSGTVTVSGSTFTGNSASNSGGGLYNGGTATVSDCSFTSNSANLCGGIENYGTATVIGSTFTSNFAGVKGGGLENETGGTATVSDSTFTSNSAGTLGGGIENYGTATVSDSTFTSNSASSGNGGGIDNESGGTATVSGSTFSSNSATDGGGIDNNGTLTLTNSTLSGNSANDSGGGIDNESSEGGIGTLTLTNSTLSGNSAANDGGGIDNNGMATLNNTIVANSPSGGDVANFATLTGSHNLIEDGSGGLAGTITGDPKLGPLANNGGSTQTMALLAGSPAINAGDNALAVDPTTGLPLATDQRGAPFVRIAGGTVDIGAYEAQTLNLVVTTTADENNSNYNPADLSLREAIELANANPGTDTITFQIPGSGPYIIQPLTVLPTITDPVVLDGTSQTGFPGTPIIQINGGGLAGAGLTLGTGSSGSTVKGMDTYNFSGAGILIQTNNNLIEGDYLGTGVSGTAAGPGNQIGIDVVNGANNIIGGTVAGSGNVIAFNTGAAVTVDTGTGNAIRQNSIFANRQGIVLVNGGNANQPAPTLTAAESFLGTTMVEGQLSGFAASTTYTIEFFASAPGDPSTPGQAHLFLGSQPFTTNGSGAATISATLSATVPVGQVITATATSVPDNNTSEFATGVIVASPFVVTNTNNSGIGSLRQAILNADREAGHTISFAIPGAGVHTIAPTSALPTITDPVIIDGYTQRGASPNTLSVGDNAILLIELSGASAPLGTSGLTISGNGGGSTITGLVINGFKPTADPTNPLRGDGIDLTSNGNVIIGNFIGTNAAGTAALGNTLDGISLNDASNNRIIGNVVSGNGINQDAAGINLESDDSNNIIAGNEIGTNAAGDAMLGNSLHGIFLGNGSSNNTIGDNVIFGNGKFPVANLSTQGGVAVYIFGVDTSGNVVQGNKIGTHAAGIAALDNSVIGVLINQSRGNTVQGNVISGNRHMGIEIAGGTASGNLVQDNSIDTNGSDGIFINDAPNNTIGGTPAGAGNRVSGNGFVGIQLFGQLTKNNAIQGNIISDNRLGGILVNTSANNTIGGTGPGQANQGQSIPIFEPLGLTDPGTTSSVAARRRSRRGKATPTRTRAVVPSSHHPSGPAAHILRHWSPSGGKKRSPHRV